MACAKCVDVRPGHCRAATPQRDSYLVPGRPAFGNHAVVCSEPAQPPGHIHAFKAYTPRPWRPRRVRKDLHQRLTLQIDVRPCIRHRGVERGAAKPLVNRGEIHTGFEQMNRRRMTQRMRMDALVLQRRNLFGALGEPPGISSRSAARASPRCVRPRIVRNAPDGTSRGCSP